MAEAQAGVRRLGQLLDDCTLCPRRCRVDRLAGALGACGSGALAQVVSHGPHFGEERVLVGPGGSGTIFLSGCNLDCVFCQNWQISQMCGGRDCDSEDLADLAEDLADRGCANINFVSPTHIAHLVAAAIVEIRSRGLGIPVVYNCGGYESLETLRALDGLVEIYMPDFKWADAAAGSRYSGVADYPAVAAAALAEMARQVGPLQTDEGGLASRGVLVRHLVMPGDMARSRRVLEIVARQAPGAAVNIMAQYQPAFRSREFPELLVELDPAEISSLRSHAVDLGLQCLEH